MIDISKFWVAEWIVCTFFTYLILLAVRRPLQRRHRLRVLAVSMVCIGLSVMLSQLRPSPALQIVREWIPGIYLAWVLAVWAFLRATDDGRRATPTRLRPGSV